MNSKKIVITGGAGFIGSNLARNLSADNQVIIIDDLSTGNIGNIEDLVDNNKAEFIKGSITDLELLYKTFKNVHYVFHEAAIASVPRSIQDPVTTCNVSINGTLNVLLAARDCGVKKVVYASSSSVYGDISTYPITEDMTPNPLSPYAIGKLTSEYYCSVFSKIFNLPTVVLRYFNVYGPRQDSNGEYAAVIPKFITNILKNIPSVIFGDGLQTRDFIYIDDVVKINILATENDITGVFNVAGGKQITINQLAKTIMNICDKDLEIRYNAARPGDIKHSFADITKVKEKMGYHPSINIENGLKQTIQWFQKQI